MFISVFILGLFYYWYALANRYIIFLYEHTAAGIPPAQPFDEMTSSRYWMSGLVAAGAVMVLYTAANWLWGQVTARRKKQFVPSTWWQVWVLSAIPISIGIPAITMTVNSPALPPSLAAACVVATLLGLAVALLPGKWAAERPVDLLWLVADGVGLMPALLLLRAVELPGRGLSVSYVTAWLLAIGGLLAGAVWLAGMSLLRLWRHKETPNAGVLLLAGLGLSYVLMPLFHHLLATPPAYRYISTASNFFAFNLGIQFLALMVAAGLAVGVTRGRRWLRVRYGNL
ncbi:MAG: hypothetical protein KJ077_41280 [Anaerolineae bacterium]|nr:hypothetical protein [Anaerolineae bacterium]